MTQRNDGLSAVTRHAWNKRDRVLPLLRHRAPRTLAALAHGAGWLWGPNERSLAKYANAHRGRRAFVVATGPSLLLEDLERLRGELTFSCNKIFLAFDRVEWRPTYYAVTDQLVAEQNRGKVRDLPLTKFFSDALMPVLGADAGIYVHSLPRWRPEGLFSSNLLRGYYEGSTVLHFLMQLAFHMGVRQVYVLGLDHHFQVPAAPKADAVERTGAVRLRAHEVLAGDGQNNHFHPDYRPSGEAWVAPRLLDSENAYRAAQRVYRAHGGEIWNASRRTQLEVFPRVTLDEVLGSRL